MPIPFSIAAFLPSITVNYQSVASAFVAIDAAAIAVYITILGARKVLGMVRDTDSYRAFQMDVAMREDRLRDIKKRIRRGELVDRASRAQVAHFEGTRRQRGGGGWLDDIFGDESRKDRW